MIRILTILILFSSTAFGQRYFFSNGKPAIISPILPADFSGNTAAFSMRKVKTGYAGYCLKVRRSSDNTTLDIGFSGYDFDISTFSGFVGGGNGFVDTWYDQSGAGLNAAQATQANQPQIILSHKNGHPSLLFDGTDRLEIASSTTSFNSFHLTTGSFSIITQTGTTADPNALYGYFGNNALTGTNKGFCFAYDDRASVPRNNSYFLLCSRSGSGSNMILDISADKITANAYSIIQSTTDVTIGTANLRDRVYVNNSSVISTNTATSTPTAGNGAFNLQIGSAGNAASLFTGYIAELVFYNVVLTSNQLSIQVNNQNTYWAIY